MPESDNAATGPTRDYIGYGPHVPKVEWPGGALLAVNFVINWEEGSEYSFDVDGRNEGQGEFSYAMTPGHRDLAVESAYEYGSRAGIWRLFRLFDEYSLKTTIFASGLALEQNPEVGRWIERSGHEACGHGYRWNEAWLSESEEAEREQIARAVAAIRATCGERPHGWYSRYSASPNTRRLLVEEGGFLYDSDAYNDDLPYYTPVGESSHLIVPYTLVYNDGWIINQGHAKPADFAEHCSAGFNELLREGAAGYPKMMSIGLHARWMGQAGRASGLRQFIEHVLAHEQIWVTTRVEIAQWWHERHSTFN